MHGRRRGDEAVKARQGAPESLRPAGITAASDWGIVEEEWRPQCQAVKYSLLNFEYCCKSFPGNVLRFNSIQIVEWLADLLAQDEAESQAELEGKLGVDRTRIGQSLRLMRLPEYTRVNLKRDRQLNEFRIRRMVACGSRIRPD